MRPSTNKSRINEWDARYTSASEHVERPDPVSADEGVPWGVGGAGARMNLRPRSWRWLGK
jgi:hypothetical protein